MPTLAMPYVLVPSAALSPYPLMANGLQAGGTDAPHTNLNFNMPSIMSPAHFVVSSGHFAVAGTAEFNGSGPALCSPEQAGLLGSGSLPPHSPLEPRQSVALPLKEPQVGPPTDTLYRHTLTTHPFWEAGIKWASMIYAVTRCTTFLLSATLKMSNLTQFIIMLNSISARSSAFLWLCIPPL